MTLGVLPVVEELARLRHATGDMTAATMTLVVFFEDDSVAGWVTQRTHAIAEKHPSRVLLLDGTQTEDTHRADQACTRGEWVELGCKGSSADALRAALAALALPEAPIVLAWIGRTIANDERFLALARAAHTVVVSSSVVFTDNRALDDLIVFVERHPEIAVQDIAYLRLAAWQELVAEFFDEPDLLDELTRLRDVQVSAGSDAEMYYLLGWLASRLGWSPCGGNQFCNAAGDIIRFSLVREGPPRRLSRVVLASANVSFAAFVHPNDDAAVCLRISGAKEREERSAPLHTMDIASLIERAILNTSRDDVFLQSLIAARQILDRRTQ